MGVLACVGYCSFIFLDELDDDVGGEIGCGEGPTRDSKQDTAPGPNTNHPARTHPPQNHGPTSVIPPEKQLGKRPPRMQVRGLHHTSSTHRTRGTEDTPFLQGLLFNPNPI